MRLIEREGNIVREHELIPNHDKIRQYKIEQMATFPIETRVLNASTNAVDVLNVKGFKIIDVKNLSFNKRSLGFFRKYHNITIHKELKQENDVLGYSRRFNYILKVLDSYYGGIYDNNSLIRVKDEDSDVLYLLTTGEYVYKSEYSKHRNIPDVINLPRSLFVLHMLLKEQYGLLGDLDISEQLDLFDYKKTKEFSIESSKTDFQDPDYLMNYFFNSQITERCLASSKVLRLAKEKDMLQKK